MLNCRSTISKVLLVLGASFAVAIASGTGTSGGTHGTMQQQGERTDSGGTMPGGGETMPPGNATMSEGAAGMTSGGASEAMPQGGEMTGQDGGGTMPGGGEAMPPGNSAAMPGDTGNAMPDAGGASQPMPDMQ